MHLISIWKYDNRARTNERMNEWISFSPNPPSLFNSLEDWIVRCLTVRVRAVPIFSIPADTVMQRQKSSSLHHGTLRYGNIFVQGSIDACVVWFEYYLSSQFDNNKTNESCGHHHSSDCSVYSSISADIEYISYISITNIIVFITRVIIIINMLTDSRYTVINSFAHYNRSVVN